jgi:hypothetical protein
MTIMKREILTSLVIFLALGCLSYAEQMQEPALHGSVDVTFTGKYVWRGFDVYGDKSAIHPSIDLDLCGTGFGLNIIGHRANSSGFELTERWDYSLYYLGNLFQGESYETIYRLAYIYYNFPDLSSHKSAALIRNDIGSLDLQELQAYLAWPNILTVKGLVPAYVLVKLWPSNSKTIVGARSAQFAQAMGGKSPLGLKGGGTASGFAHIFMLDYGLPVSCPITDVERILNLHSEVVYNDGVGPDGSNVDHDWSNAVFGISTDFNIVENLVFTPGLYHQITMDKSVNGDKDETWVSLGLKYKF